MDPKLRSICSIGTLMAAAALVLAPSKAAAQVVDNVSFVELFKLHERWDGTAFENPYEFEACVEGDGVTFVTVTVPTATPRVETLTDPWEDGEFCWSEEFADADALNAKYPNGEYTFAILTLTGSDSKSVDFSPTYSEPGAWLRVTAPTDGATGVPHDSDLNVTWAPESKPGCPAGDCFDGIEFFLIDDALDHDVFEEFLLPTELGVTVPASILQPDTPYEIEVGTYNGLIDLSGTQTTDDLLDPIDLVAIWEDLNMTEFNKVPEPAAGLLQISVLATLGWLARRRRNLR